MDIIIRKSEYIGCVPAPASKSFLHRYLFLSAACGDNTQINFSGKVSDDIKATVNCLESFGAEITENEKGFLVTPARYGGNAKFDSLESGTTFRFSVPLAAAFRKNAEIFCRGRLKDRPNKPFFDSLSEHGVKISDETLPVRVSGDLQGGIFTLPGNISSQFVSAILTALPVSKQSGTIKLTSRLQSDSYVKMTASAMEKFGVKVNFSENGFSVNGKNGYVSPKEINCPNDWSNAAYFLCLGAISGKMSVSGLSFDDFQGDSRITDILKRFGADVKIENGIVTVSKKPLKGTEIDAFDIPDLVCVLAVVACAAVGKTVIKNTQRLRYKESDRIESTKNMIRSLGGDISYRNGNLEINGKGYLDGGEVSSCSDHRIAMSTAVARAICKNDIILRNASSVSKSYRDFFEIFEKAGGKYDVIQLR